MKTAYEWERLKKGPGSMAGEAAWERLLYGIVNWFVSALVLWLFWDALFPEWVNLPALTFWRAFALIGISKTLLPRST